jgi:16S rRNA (uracil1498-N3)-methyltransferase
VVTNGKYSGYLATVQENLKYSISIKIDCELDLTPVSKLKITLAIAVPLGNVMDEIIQHVTELGVNTIIPLISELTQAPKRFNNPKKIERWNRIARGAMKQCQSFVLPQVTQPVKLPELFSKYENFTNVYIAHPGGKSPLSIADEHTEGDILIQIGPEGGFTDAERKQSIEKGAIAIDLGPRRLRVATAVYAILSLLQAKCEGWGISN